MERKRCHAIIASVAQIHASWIEYCCTREHYCSSGTCGHKGWSIVVHESIILAQVHAS